MRFALLFAAAAALLAPQAHAAIACTISATAINVVYSGAVNNSGGTFTLNCTRLGTDPTTQTYWVGVLPTAGNPRRLFRHGGGTTAADRLNANLYKDNTTTDWGSTGTARVAGTINFGAGLNATATLNYDFRIPAQTGKTAGIYDQLYTVQLQLATAGAVVATADFFPTASVPTQCFVGSVVSGNTAPNTVSPSTITLNYTSFTTTAATANMSFTVDCTMNTSYSLAISPASGTLLGLPYTVNFTSNGLPTITGQSGSGLAQSYGVTATIPANQAGTCATAVCSATQATTITITY